MNFIEFVGHHKELLGQILAAKRDLRRNLLIFLTGVGEVWQLLPPEMTQEDKVSFLHASVEKLVQELGQCSSLLDEQLNRLVDEYLTSRQAALASAQEIQTKLKDDHDALVKENASLNDGMDALRKENDDLHATVVSNSHAMGQAISVLHDLKPGFLPNLLGSSDEKLQSALSILEQAIKK